MDYIKTIILNLQTDICLNQYKDNHIYLENLNLQLVKNKLWFVIE